MNGRARTAGVPGGAIFRETPEEDRALQVIDGPYGLSVGPIANWRGLQMTGEDCRWTAGIVRELPIRRGPQGPTLTLLEGSIFQRTGALAIQLEVHARDSRDCSPGGAYRADTGRTGRLGTLDTNSSYTPRAPWTLYFPSNFILFVLSSKARPC